MNVQSVPGEPLRFLVSSRSRVSIKHQVDLHEHDWNGWCSCEDFEFNRLPVFNRNKYPSDQSRCVHLRIVREKMLNHLLHRIAVEIGQERE